MAVAIECLIAPSRLRWLRSDIPLFDRALVWLQRRTCLTMWYIDWDACGEFLRAAYGKDAAHGGMPCAIPTASEGEVKLLQPLHPVFEGDRSVTAVSNRALDDWGVGSRTPLDQLSRLQM